MELFKTLCGMLSTGGDCTIVARKTASGKLTVSVLVTDPSVKDENKNYIAPLIVKGTAEELDEGFVKAITAPMEEAAGLLTSIKQFEESKKVAEKKMAEKKSAAPSKGSKPAAKTGKTESPKPATDVAEAKDDDEDNLFNAESLTSDSEAQVEVRPSGPQQEELEHAPEPEPEPAPAAGQQEDETSGYDYKSAWIKAKELVAGKDYAGAIRFMTRCLELAPEEHKGILEGNIVKCKLALAGAVA